MRVFAKSHFIDDLKHSAAMGRWFRNMSIHCLQLWWCSSGSEPLPDGLKNLMCALVHRDIPVRCWTFTWEAWDPMRTGRLNTGWAPGNQLWYVEGAVDGKVNLFDFFEDFSSWMGGCIWLLGRPRACMNICKSQCLGSDSLCRSCSETLDDILVLTSSKCCLKDSVLSRCTLRWGVLKFQALVVKKLVWFC